MTAELRYPDPRLAGAGFVLRPWDATDAEAVVVACTDPDTQRFITAMPRPYTLEHAQQFIGAADASRQSGVAIGMAMSDPETGAAIGSITLHTVSPRHWYVGYWLTPSARGKGITTGAVRALSRWAFTEYADLARISLYTLPDNAASQAVATKAGFTREGLLRQWDHSAGFPEDVVMFSLVRADLE